MEGVTFEAMARNFIGPPSQDSSEVEMIAEAMQAAYIRALRDLSWRRGAVDFLFEDPRAKRLDDVIAEVRRKGGPI